MTWQSWRFGVDDLLNDMQLFDDEPQHQPFSSRLGMIHIYFSFIQTDPEAVWRVMQRLKFIVMDARCIPGELIVQYMGYSPLFDEWHPTSLVPVYDVRVMRTAEDGEVITVSKRV